MAEYNPELEAARKKADTLGVSWKPQQKAETILKNCEAHLEEGTELDDDDTMEVEPLDLNTPKVYGDDTVFLTEEGLIDRTKIKRNIKKYGRSGYHPKVRMALKKEAEELVRVKITCMNPAKKSWKGEMLSMTNAVTGTIKKFIPFNTEHADAYHIPRALLNLLQSREYQAFTEVKVKGKKVKRPRQVKEFAIEILPPLTQKELDAIAKRQMADDGGE